MGNLGWLGRVILAAGAVAAVAGAVSASMTRTPGTLTDKRDGKTYRTVVIGNKRWMAENLNYQTDSSWCYNNDTSYCNKYGRLYSFNTARTVCPAGYYLPSNKDWSDLGREVRVLDVYKKHRYRFYYSSRDTIDFFYGDAVET